MYHGTYFIISAGHIIVCIYAATIIRGMMRVIQQVCGAFVVL